MVRPPRISTVSLAILCALSISNVYVTAVCTIPDGYKSYAWFQLYTDVPKAQWIYALYDSDKIVTTRNDNSSTFKLEYSCVSSHLEDGFFYYISSQAMFGESYCTKAKLTPDGNAIFASDIQTNSADSKTCPAMFTESCFGSSGQIPICSAVWRPKSPPNGPPKFTLVQSPFQGAYQLTVNGTQCAGNATAQGSAIQFKACQGIATTTYKNRTIFQESMSVLGTVDGSVLTTGEKNMTVLLLMSSDNVTLYCAKYTVMPDKSINMTIDVSSESFASCALPATVVSTDNRFVSLVMTATSSSALPSAGSSVTASGVTSQVTGQSTRITGTTAAASSGINTPVTGTAGTVGTAGTIRTSSGVSSVSVSGTSTSMTTRGISSGTQTTNLGITTPTAAATTQATTMATSAATSSAATTAATSATAASTVAAGSTTVSQGAGVSTTPSSISVSTTTASIGLSSQTSVLVSVSGAGPAFTTTPTTSRDQSPISTVSTTTKPTTPSVCLGFTCPSPFQCNVDQQGAPSCGCAPGTSLSNTTGQCSPSSGKSSGSPAWVIAVGLIGAMLVAAAVGFIVMCCMRSAWLARQGPMAYGFRQQHFHRHYPEQLSPSYFNDKFPNYEVNMQPVTFPSRGSVYGGTLGLGFGGYTGQTKVCNHYPVMGNNSYVMIKSSIPPD